MTLQLFEINSGSKGQKRSIPALVVKRALSAGELGRKWLENLDSLITVLEKQWSIVAGRVLFGGTHAYVAYADGRDGAKYVLKIDMPEDLGGEFRNGIAVLEQADGQGYAKLFAYDLEKRACLLERLGKPVNQLGCPVDEQLRIICSALQASWKKSAGNTGLPSGIDSVVWFRKFIEDTWKALNCPCSSTVIRRALLYLASREKNMNPAEYVLLHGDAHGGNTLQDLSGNQTFKLIDPDGIFYERAYDLGVLMREWVDEYMPSPLQKGKERCEYLHHLTGVSWQAIWEWGFLQTVSTSFVLLQTGQEDTGRKMLNVAEHWTAEHVKI